jgi:hypothetical protein
LFKNLHTENQFFNTQEVREMAAMVHGTNNKKPTIPITITGDEGSAKRNIIRKGGKQVVRKDTPGMIS